MSEPTIYTSEHTFEEVRFSGLKVSGMITTSRDLEDRKGLKWVWRESHAKAALSPGYSSLSGAGMPAYMHPDRHVLLTITWECSLKMEMTLPGSLPQVPASVSPQ